MTPDMLNEAKRIVWAELPKYLTNEFVIDDVEAEIREGPFFEDYIHINVILEDDHPELDGRKLNKFSYEMYPIFERAGVTPHPAISYSNRGEFAR